MIKKIKIKMSSINGRRIVSLDCEMVEGVGGINILARVSIVDYYGTVILNSFVSSSNEIVNFRTEWSGVRPHNLIGAPSFSTIQRKVREIISNKIVVGHSLHVDFKVLELEHPIQYRRDIAKSRFLIQKYGNSMGQPVSLKRLTLEIFNRQIQVNEHDSIEDATATLNIYKHYQDEIEDEINEMVRHQGSTEMEPEETETSGFASNLVLAGLAVGSAVALFSLFKRNNRND